MHLKWMQHFLQVASLLKLQRLLSRHRMISLNRDLLRSLTKLRSVSFMTKTVGILGNHTLIQNRYGLTKGPAFHPQASAPLFRSEYPARIFKSAFPHLSHGVLNVWH